MNTQEKFTYQGLKLEEEPNYDLSDYMASATELSSFQDFQGIDNDAPLPIFMVRQMAAY